MLDLGCGSGRPMAEYVVAQGCRALVVDQSKAMPAIARLRLPTERWVLSPMKGYQPGEEFCGALLWDSLFHPWRLDSGNPCRNNVLRGQLVSPGADCWLLHHAQHDSDASNLT